MQNKTQLRKRRLPTHGVRSYGCLHNLPEAHKAVSLRKLREQRAQWPSVPPACDDLVEAVESAIRQLADEDAGASSAA